MAKISINFIIEGNVEEKALFNLIENYGLNDAFDITYRTCCGAGNIAAYYQAAIASEKYDLVFCIYDVDDKADIKDSPYNITREKLQRVLGSKALVDTVSLCTNPNILLLLLLGYDKPKNLIDLTASKSNNTDVIKRYCDKIGNKQKYAGHQWQVDLIIDDYVGGRALYDNIIDSYNELSKDYKKEKIASNLVIVLKEIKEGNVEYFKRIIKKIGEDK